MIYFRRQLGAGIAVLMGCLPAAHAATIKTLLSITGSGDGAGPTGLIALKGSLYGTTAAGGALQAGTIYSVDPSTGARKVLYSFQGGTDGQSPTATLTPSGSLLYGMTASGGADGYGAIYSFDPSTNAETVVYSFRSAGNGANPTGSLTALDGNLYGLTIRGSQSNNGTIFSFNPSTGAETVIHSFSQYAAYGTLTVAGGLLYGIQAPPSSYGSVFSIDPASHAFKTVYNFKGPSASPRDGAIPNGPLLLVGNDLYGTAQREGAGYGVIFKIDLSSGAEIVAYDFQGGADGAFPTEGLTSVGGSLYGTTSADGPSKQGTVYSFDPASGIETVLGPLTQIVGGGLDVSQAPLVSLDGLLYGANYNYYSRIAPPQQAINSGTVFSINPSTGTPATVSTFTGLFGPDLQANGGIVVIPGMLEATTALGGAASAGAIISINPISGAAKTQYSFQGETAGTFPDSALTAVNGLLYGTTSAGGAHDCGNIFSFNSKTRAVTVVYSFTGPSDACFPIAGLTNVGGILYGLNYGDMTSPSKIFSFNPATGKEALLYSQLDGLTKTSLTNLNGVLYGTIDSVGVDGSGEIFKFDPATGTFTVVYTFEASNSDDGRFPDSTLTVVGNLLYGTTTSSTDTACGVVYSFNPATNSESVLHEFAADGVDGCNPNSNVVYLNKMLYGTTTSGGTSNAGTAFAINPATSAETIIASFPGQGGGGSNPRGSLVTVKSSLFGLTSTGGASGFGTVFQITP